MIPLNFKIIYNITFVQLNCLNLKLMSRKSKKYLYSSFLRMVLMDGCETWSVTKGDEGTYTYLKKNSTNTKMDGQSKNSSHGNFRKNKN